MTTAQAYSGFWRIGGDNLDGWTNKPSSYYLAGTIDEVAIYPTALTGAQVRDHYTKSGRTLAGPAAPTDSYGAAVYHDDPALYWRLDEAAGTTAADSSANASNGTYAGGVSYRTPSTVANPAYGASFNGSNATVGSKATFTNPSNYSEEIWFNTTTTNGGKLMGFGDQQSGTLEQLRPAHLHEPDGPADLRHLDRQRQPDHHAGELQRRRLAPHGRDPGQTDGMKLYVDGSLVGTNAQTSAQSYTGYWRVGGDTSWCCSNFFTGALDEAAVYSTVLSAAQVKAHYNASPAAVNVAPVAGFGSSCTDGACAFDASTSSDSDGTIAGYAWDFGDGQTSTNAAPTHGYTASGSYTVSLTVTDNKGATNAVTHHGLGNRATAEPEPDRRLHQLLHRVVVRLRQLDAAPIPTARWRPTPGPSATAPPRPRPTRRTATPPTAATTSR